MKNRIILASSSPRRKELLENVGIKFEVISPLSDESILDYENPKDYVIRLAEEKALSVAQLQGDKSFIIGSDTIVLVDDDILGKPFNEEEAAKMLQRISGRTHSVLTAFSIVQPQDKVLHSEVVETMVRVKTLEPGEIEGYIKTGEPMDKAGAYGIQGIGAFMIKGIEGSYTNVVGLPLVEVLEALNKLGALRLFCGDGLRK
ncbi:MAG: Maf family protein [Thermodesulfobacteriales bacterium]|jgi:septum formation protein